MAVNVTQKDKTLRQLADWCEHKLEDIDCLTGVDLYWEGYADAMEQVIDRCEELTGYTGAMPLEVPNQSEEEENQ